MLAVHELELFHILNTLAPSLFKRSQIILKVKALKGALMSGTGGCITLLKVRTQQITYAHACTSHLVGVCGAYSTTCCTNLVGSL